MTFPTATAADEAKFNFYAAIKDLWANDPDKNEVLVTYGAPGTYMPNDVVSFMGIRSNITHGPNGYGTRARDEVISIDVMISVVRAGGPEQEIEAAKRAYVLLRALDTYTRVTDTTLGGAVLWCFCIQHQSSGFTDPTLLEQGRVIEITATFDAKARISS